MTIVLLASVSLLVLLVTSHPILLSDPGPGELTPVLSAVQAPFHVHPGLDDVKLDTVHLHSPSQKQQIEYISELNTEDVTAPLFEISSRVYSFFQDFLDKKNNEFGTKNAFNSPMIDHVTNEQAVASAAADEQQEVPIDEVPTNPLVVLAFSCMAAFLTLACIALTLYIVRSLRARIFTYKTTREAFLHSWGSQEVTSTTTRDYFGGHHCLHAVVERQHLVCAEEGSVERHDFYTEDKHLDVVSDSDLESLAELDDIDTKYQDALDIMPLPITHDLLLEEHVSHQSHFNDPSLPPLGSYPLDQRTADRSPRIFVLDSSPATRPAWPVRAVDSPPLALSLGEIGDVDSTLPQIHSSRRAYRSAVPEFDVALAMQLRPGIGISADSAWMVRFLMTIFGWFAVALTSNA